MVNFQGVSKVCFRGETFQQPGTWSSLVRLGIYDVTSSDPSGTHHWKILKEVLLMEEGSLSSWYLFIIANRCIFSLYLAQATTINFLHHPTPWCFILSLTQVPGRQMAKFWLPRYTRALVILNCFRLAEAGIGRGLANAVGHWYTGTQTYPKLEGNAFHVVNQAVVDKYISFVCVAANQYVTNAYTKVHFDMARNPLKHYNKKADDVSLEEASKEMLLTFGSVLPDVGTTIELIRRATNPPKNTQAWVFRNNADPIWLFAYPLVSFVVYKNFFKKAHMIFYDCDVGTFLFMALRNDKSVFQDVRLCLFVPNMPQVHVSVQDIVNKVCVSTFLSVESLLAWNNEYFPQVVTTEASVGTALLATSQKDGSFTVLVAEMKTKLQDAFKP